MSAFRTNRFALAATLAATAAPAFALFGVGDIVFDPTIHGWNLYHESKELVHWAEEIKKFEDFVAQQITTAEKITDLRNGLTSRIGDWKGVYDRAVSLRNRAENLRAPVGGSFSTIAVVDYGAPALVYSNHGNFGAIQTKTAYGTKFDFEDARLKRYHSVFAINDDIEKSAGQADAEIREVLGEIAGTSQEIVEAGDQEKLAKLQEKKSTLVLRLQELQRQLDQKIKLLTIQATLNENRAAMERDVKREQVRQTFKEARERDAALINP
jgi:hypothetical protein